MSGRHHKDDRDDEPAKVCPHCGSSDTRLSRHNKGLMALLLTVLNRSRFRCRACKHHFTSRN